jgi:hypothetical protein
LRRAATFLRQTGIEIAHDREGHRRNRKITITKADNSEVQPSALSAAPADVANRPQVANPVQTEGEQADANTIPADNEPCASVRSKPLEICPADDADGRDAEYPPVSAGWRGFRFDFGICQKSQHPLDRIFAAHDRDAEGRICLGVPISEAGAIKEILPVAEIMRRLVAETEAALSRAVDFR